MVAVHEDATTLMMLKRDLEDAGTFDVTGARNPLSAIERLRRSDEQIVGILINWALPNHGGPRFLCALNGAAMKRRPFVVAFSSSWAQDDLARALQLGVDAILIPPISAEELESELRSLISRGRSQSRTRLLENAHANLLQSDERLWNFDTDPAWRQRMMTLVKSVRGPAGDRTELVVDELLLNLDTVAETPLDPRYVQALQHLVREGGQGIDTLAAYMEIDRDRLSEMFGVVARKCGFVPSAGDFRTDPGPLLDEIGQLVLQRAVEPGSIFAAEDGIRGLAVRLMGMEDEELGDSDDLCAFADEIARRLRVADHDLDELSPEAVRRLAARFVTEPDERAALDHARLAVLNRALHGLGDARPSLGQLKGVSNILAVEGGDQSAVDRLVSLLGDLDPDPSTGSLDAATFERLAAALSSVGPGVPKGLKEAVGHLARASQDGGDVDQRRVRLLVRAMRGDADTRVGRPVLTSVAVCIDPRRGDAICSDALELLKLVGSRTPERRTRLFQLVLSLRKRPQSVAQDAHRLKVIMQAALQNGAQLTPTLIEKLVEFVNREVTGTRRAAQRAPEPAPSAMESALAVGHRDRLLRDAGLAAAAIGTNVLDEIVVRLPSSNEPKLEASERIRLQVAAALIARLQDPSAREALLQAVDRRNGEDGVAQRTFATLLDRVGERETADNMKTLGQMFDEMSTEAEAAEHAATAVIERVEARGSGVAPRERYTSADVDRFLGSSDLDSALVAVEEVRDDDPLLIGLLNEIGLALRNMGRAAEASAYYTRALGLQPNRLNLLFNYGRLQFELGDLVTAVPALQRVRRLAPNFAPAAQLLQEAETRLADEKASA